MINSIQLKNVASYKDYVDITELGKVNFFFGYNGCGKSTIANYLYSLRSDNGRFSECNQIGFDAEKEHVYVFNEDFIQLNFIHNKTQRGIFSLNEENELITQKITECNSSITRKNNQVEVIKRRSNKADIFFDDLKRGIITSCFEKRNQFKAFSKIKLKHSGRKENHYKEISCLIEVDPSKLVAEPLDSLLSDYTYLFEKSLKKVGSNIDLIIYDELVSKEKYINLLLADVIISKETTDLSPLIERLDNKKWVEDGHKFIEGNSNLEVCPFCQEPLKNSFKQKIEAYFDEVYKEKINKIKEQWEDYNKTFYTLTSVLNKIKHEFNENGLLSEFITKLNTFRSNNEKIIEAKLAKPNVVYQLDTIVEYCDGFQGIFQTINTNNDDVDNLSSKQNLLENKIWRNLATECKEYVQSLDLKENQLNCLKKKFRKKLSELNDEIAKIEAEIKLLRSQTVNTSDAVIAINSILKSSGFIGFEIIEKELENNISQYFLQREGGENDNVFKTLSEGEKAFISFLYFYQLCIGTEDVKEKDKKKIIVIDDPVSSLDSQVLFIVTTLIHQLIQRKGKGGNEKKQLQNSTIEQVFILSHNIYFYKEVSLDKRPICRNRKHYRIEKHNNCSRITMINTPILDDYHMLWNELKNIKTSSIDNVSNITIANIMRRILESFVNFTDLGKDVWSSISAMDTSSSEYVICSAFISSIQDSSHKVNPYDDLYFQRIINYNPTELFVSFERIFIKIGKDHYLRMMDIDENDIVAINSEEELKEEKRILTEVD